MFPIWLTDAVTPDIDRAFHYTMLWGLEGLEVGALGSASDRVPYVDEAKLRRRIQEHHLPVEAVTPGLFQGPSSARAMWLNDLLVLKETLAFCRRISCPRVVISAFAEEDPREAMPPEAAIEALQKAGDAATSADITLCILNEPDSLCATGTALAELLAAVNHPQVRAAWQPAVALEAGEDAADGLAALGEQVALVRCANRVQVEGRWLAAAVGEGAVDYGLQFEQLRNTGFDGPVSLLVDVEPGQGQRPSDDAPSRKPRYALRAATWLIRMLRPS